MQTDHTVGKGPGGGTRVIGLDLALGRTGWAVVESGPRLVAVGAFTLPGRKRSRGGVEPLADWNLRRLKAIREEVTNLRSEYHFVVLAYEYADRPRHARTRDSIGREYKAAFGLGLSQGILLSAVEHLVDAGEVQIAALGQSEVKRTATGNSEAPKAQVKRWLEIRYGFDLSWLDSEKQQDEVDGIAVACTALRAID